MTTSELCDKLRAHNPDPNWQSLFDEAALMIESLARNVETLKRENEALRQRLADIGALLTVVGQNHDH